MLAFVTRYIYNAWLKYFKCNRRMIEFLIRAKKYYVYSEIEIKQYNTKTGNLKMD
jgi:hypothetical protein